MSETETNPRRAEGLEVNEAEDGLVVYDPAQDMVHHLNPTASIIFDLCDGTRDPEEIAGIVGEAYSLAAPPAEDVQAGLSDLAENQLIHWGGQSEGGRIRPSPAP